MSTHEGRCDIQRFTVCISIDMYYMDCRHRSSRNILRRRVALQLVAVNASAVRLKPLSGRERIDLDLGTIKAFGTIQRFTLVT